MKYILKALHGMRMTVHQLFSDLQDLEKPSIHTMELDQENLILNQIERHNAMNDGELRLDLEKQYGVTKWAKRLIEEILTTRIRAREFAQ